MRATEKIINNERDTGWDGPGHSPRPIVHTLTRLSFGAEDIERQERKRRVNGFTLLSGYGQALKKKRKPNGTTHILYKHKSLIFHKS